MRHDEDEHAMPDVRAAGLSDDADDTERDTEQDTEQDTERNTEDDSERDEDDTESDEDDTEDDEEDADDGADDDEDLDEDLDEEFPTGDGTADGDAVICCPYCGESIEIALDAGGGARQQYVEDCEVCCQPWQVSVQYQADGSADVQVTALDE